MCNKLGEMERQTNKKEINSDFQGRIIWNNRVKKKIDKNKKERKKKKYAIIIDWFW